MTQAYGQSGTVPERLSPHSVVLGLDLDALTIEETVERCNDAMARHEPMLIGVVNAAKIVNLRRDDLLRNSLLKCDLLLADGQSVVWASRILRRPVPERVSGIDLFEALLQLADQRRRSVYLLGARPDVLATLVHSIEGRWPGLRVVGVRDGYFDESESEAVAAAIRACEPDMLFLGMGSPKKEIFIGTYGATLGVSIVHGVGGSFDVMAGVTKRAPAAWQRSGMEWAYRLLQEPRRLFGRYLRTNTAFVSLVIQEVFRETPVYPRFAGAAAKSNVADA